MKFNKRQLELLAEGATMEVVLAAATPADDGTKTVVDASAINTEVAAQLTEALGTIETMKTAEAAQATALAEMQAKLDEAETAKAKAEETAAALFAATHARTSAMAVAMGHSAPAPDMSAADLATLHTKLDTEFKAAYKPGQQSNNTAKASDADVKAQRQNARILAQAKSLPGSI